MAAKRKQVQTFGLAALGLSPGDAGEAGARERVVQLEPLPERAAGEIVEDDGSAAARVAALLAQRGVL